MGIGKKFLNIVLIVKSVVLWNVLKYGSDMMYTYPEAKNWYTRIESMIADLLGWYKCPREHPLTVRTGAIFMTRGKYWGESKNLIMDGFNIISDVLRNENSKGIYEVVYQTRAYCTRTGNQLPFVLSWVAWKASKPGGEVYLSREMAEYIQGQIVELQKYYCVYRNSHKYILGSALEVYPDMYEWSVIR